MNAFWRDYPEISEELNAVESIVKDNIKGSDSYFSDSIIPLVEQGGKMLRPAFMLLSAGFGKYDAGKMRNLAAAVEMLHTATLVHDDIIDDSKLRRGCESVQSKYGKEYAVYAGDYLFCQCFNMLSQYNYSIENLRNISKAVKKICMGEIRQYSFRYTRKLDFKKYIRIISGKTAALFVLSFAVGATEAGCDEKTVRLLGRVGYNVGMAFQIIDDLLDYTGNTNDLGKNAQNDLKQGYYTLPIIFALEEDNNELKDILDNSSFSDKDVKRVVDLIEKCNGIRKTRELADRYTIRAFESINRLPDCESKGILRQVIEKLLNRKY